MLLAPPKFRMPLSHPHMGEGDSLGTRTLAPLSMGRLDIEGRIGLVHLPRYLIDQISQTYLWIQQNHTKHYIVTDVTNPQKNQKLNLKPKNSEKINKSNKRPTDHDCDHGSYRFIHRSLEIHGQIYMAHGWHGCNCGLSALVTWRPVTTSQTLVSPIVISISC